VHGGARTVIDGLLAENCTVLAPTFSWEFSLPPPPHLRPTRNGTDYDHSAVSPRSLTRVFSPEVQGLDRAQMGAIPGTLLGMEGRVRGNHPLNSFTAAGPLAHRLIEGQQPLNVYRPLEVLAELGGWVVLMGVDLTTMTALHLAEKLAGRNLFRRWANGQDGRAMMVETGGCSSGFGNFASILAPLARQTWVGQSHWTVWPAKETLRRAAQAILLSNAKPLSAAAGGTG
jgi:aminoglycoside 3-N-acetyltransferase